MRQSGREPGSAWVTTTTTTGDGGCGGELTTAVPRLTVAVIRFRATAIVAQTGSGPVLRRAWADLQALRLLCAGTARQPSHGVVSGAYTESASADHGKRALRGHRSMQHAPYPGCHDVGRAADSPSHHIGRDFV